VVPAPHLRSATPDLIFSDFEKKELFCHSRTQLKKFVETLEEIVPVFALPEIFIAVLLFGLRLWMWHLRLLSEPSAVNKTWHCGCLSFKDYEKFVHFNGL